MNPYKQQFAELSSDYLLQRRALGEDLADEAHVAIEEIFAERGEHLPPRPSAPIYIPAPPLPQTRTRTTIALVGMAVLTAIAVGVGTALTHTWAGFSLIAGILLVYWYVRWFGPNSAAYSEVSGEEKIAIARREGLSELMTCAAEGNIARMRELIDYGYDVNAKSPSDTTALMYAARNNREECIRILLASGADPNAISEKGSTALSLARKFSNKEAEAALRGNASG